MKTFFQTPRNPINFKKVIPLILFFLLTSVSTFYDPNPVLFVTHFLKIALAFLIASLVAIYLNRGERVYAESNQNSSEDFEVEVDIDDLPRGLV
jgi:hypothetical protein